MERDYETPGAFLIKTKFGTVSANEDNFTLSVNEMARNQEWRKAVGAEDVPFVLDELDIPF